MAVIEEKNREKVDGMLSKTEAGLRAFSLAATNLKEMRSNNQPKAEMEDTISEKDTFENENMNNKV